MFDGAHVLLVAVLWWRCVVAVDAAAQHLTISPQVWGVPTLGWPIVGWPSMIFNSPHTALPCQQEGVYPHPEDCDRFYRCSSILGTAKFSSLSFRCAEGTIFSEQGRDGGGCIPGTCTSPVPSVIATSGTPSIAETPVCFSQGRFPDPNNYGIYYECIRQNNGKFIANQQSCFGNSFDAPSQTCVSSDKVKGYSPTQYGNYIRSNFRSIMRSNEGNIAIEYPNHQKMCEQFKSAFICSDCRTLIMCLNHVAYPMPCQDGTVCSMDKNGFNGGVCHPIITEGCNCTNQDGLKIDLYDPTKFLNCSSDETIVQSCPEGSVFNSETRNCTVLDNSCAAKGRGTYVNVNDCNAYFTCQLSSNGWAQSWFKCPRDTMYNQETQECENPCDWQYGNFTCKAEGRFADPTNCQKFFHCFVNPLNSENLIKVAGICPDGYSWSQDVGNCKATESLKNKCEPLTPKPSTCTIPEKKCQSEALTACVSEHEFCECEDNIEVFPISCSPCPAGHASNKTGCFPLCSKLLCGANEVCSDDNGQVPGVCACAPGYVRKGGLCKALCSKITCAGDNEICYDEDGQVPGACTCTPGYANKGELCKALCSKMSCGDNEICYDEDGQVPGACSCAPGYAREGELCKDICVGAGGTTISTQCLVFNSASITWMSALTACSRESQQLASLHNITAVQEYMANNNLDGWHWVGVSDEGSEGTWYWLDGRPVGGPNDVTWYGVGGPTHGGAAYNCLVYRPSHGFYPQPCTRTYPYICSLDNQSSTASRDSNNGVVRFGTSPKQCPEDTFKVKNECFFLPNGSFKTWSNAQKFCRSQGGFLAEPNSTDDLLDAIENRTSGYNFWIGKLNKKIGTAMQRSTGEAHPFTGIEEGDNNCPILMKGETAPLYNGKCDDYHLFVCEK